MTHITGHIELEHRGPNIWACTQCGKQGRFAQMNAELTCPVANGMEECPACEGSGTINDTTCQHCEGQLVVSVERAVEIRKIIQQ